MRSELFSWPVTLAILVLAFGSLVAAGLPLMLTIVGLVAAAGSPGVGTQVATISIWAMNFALMFALALGIDYALFLVVRFRGARFGATRGRPARRRRDHGHRRQGGAVLRADRADLAVRGDAGAVAGVPVDGRWASCLSVVFVLAATLTLLPAVLAKLGSRVDALALPWVHAGEHRSARFAAVGGAAVASARSRYGPLALALLVVLALPVLGPADRHAQRSRSCPSERSLRVGYDQVQPAFGPGAPGDAAGRRRRPAQPDRPTQVLRGRPGHRRASCRRSRRADGRGADPGRPGQSTRRAKALGPPSTGCGRELPAGGPGRRRRRGEPRPGKRAVRRDTTGDRRRARPRLPAVARGSAGAAGRRPRSDHQPAGRRGRLRRGAG